MTGALFTEHDVEMMRLFRRTKVRMAFILSSLNEAYTSAVNPIYSIAFLDLHVSESIIEI
jgi:hypothetical protein